MGDKRFAGSYGRVDEASDKPAVILTMSDDEIIKALAHASREHDPYMANVLATEAMNRMRRSRSMTEHAAEGIIATDASDRITSANPAAERLLGWEPGSLVGRDRHDAIHALARDGERTPRERCRMRLVVSAGAPVESEDEWFTRRDGRTFPVAYVAAPIRTGAGVEGAIICFRDRSARRELEESVERWTSLIEACLRAHDRLGIGIVMIRGDTVLYENDAFCSMTGRPCAPSRHPDHLLDLVAPEQRERVLRHFEGMLAGTRPEAPLSFDLLRGDGVRVPVRAHVAPVDDEHHPNRRLVCIIERV